MMGTGIQWPEIGDEACQHFSLFALFGGVDPRNIRLTQTPASEMKSRVVAPGDEPDTFARIQPIFHQDNKLGLILELTRRGFFDGHPPEDLATLPELLKRTETFVGEDCKIQIVGDYFLPEVDAPKSLQPARQSFGTHPRFRHVSGVVSVDGSLVQQIQWVLRPDALWKITLAAGWTETTLEPDILPRVLFAFHDTFRQFCDSELPCE